MKNYLFQLWRKIIIYCSSLIAFLLQVENSENWNRSWVLWSMFNFFGGNPCDQIRRFLKVLGTHFLAKSSYNIWLPLDYFAKRHSLKIFSVSTNWATLGNYWATFNSNIWLLWKGTQKMSIYQLMDTTKMSCFERINQFKSIK